MDDDDHSFVLLDQRPHWQRRTSVHELLDIQMFGTVPVIFNWFSISCRLARCHGLQSQLDWTAQSGSIVVQRALESSLCWCQACCLLKVRRGEMTCRRMLKAMNMLGLSTNE